MENRAVFCWTRNRNDGDDEKKKPEVDDEEKLESGGEVGKGGVDRVSHLSWVCGNLSDNKFWTSKVEVGSVGICLT